jgi:hypothetical protein
MIFSKGLCPRKISSLREISPNPPSGGSINDNYPPVVASRQYEKVLT